MSQRAQVITTCLWEKGGGRREESVLLTKLAGYRRENEEVEDETRYEFCSGVEQREVSSGIFLSFCKTLCAFDGDVKNIHVVRSICPAFEVCPAFLTTGPEAKKSNVGRRM